MQASVTMRSSAYRSTVGASALNRSSSVAMDTTGSAATSPTLINGTASMSFMHSQSPPPNHGLPSFSSLVSPALVHSASSPAVYTASTGGGVATHSAPATALSSPTSAAANRNSSLSLDTSFFQGTPTSSNQQNLYIQVAVAAPAREGSAAAGGAAEGASGDQLNGKGYQSSADGAEASAVPGPGAEFWVTCPWPSTIKKMVEHPNLVYTLLAQLRAHPTMKSKALKILTASDGGNGNTSDGGLGAGDFNLPPSPSMGANPQNVSLFSSAGGSFDSPGMWSSPNDFRGAGQFRGGPGTPMTSGFADSGQSSAGSPASASANYSSSPWAFGGANNGHVQGGHGNANGGMFSNFPGIVTCPLDTIDPNILSQVETNVNHEEYIWSPPDASLYEIGNARALQAMPLPGAIKMVFPPNTMIMAWEKDGSLASPAFRALHPHSNQWLKAQVCDRRCAYRAGTSSLKRPITIRDHFRKCVYLDDNHPLKVLCTLELAAHERASQGLLPNRRRTRGARVGLKSSAEPASPMLTRSTRPSVATQGSSSATSAQTKGELGSPFSGNGNGSDTDRDGNTSAASGRGDSSYTPNDSDGDFSTEKAPRSLRGITSIANSHTPVPTGLVGGPAGGAFGQQSQVQDQQYPHLRSAEQADGHDPYMTHLRRHTAPDASRALFDGGMAAEGPLSYALHPLPTIYDDVPHATARAYSPHMPPVSSLRHSPYPQMLPSYSTVSAHYAMMPGHPYPSPHYPTSGPFTAGYTIYNPNSMS